LRITSSFSAHCRTVRLVLLSRFVARPTYTQGTMPAL
jgi:hypothetical protein